MREIKFRVWNTISKTMRSFSEIKRCSVFAMADGLSSNDFIVLPLKNSILNQFTGLLDKQGVEVYEGDIIKVHSYTVTGLGKVGFNNGSFVFNKFEYPTSQVLHSFSEIEVIGNIYEHQHLLGGE